MKLIKIDIDKPRISTHDVNKILKVKSILGLDINSVKIEKSHSGNYHITFEVQNNLNDFEIVAIQAMMGSDYKRECYNLLRVASGKFKNKEWNILFKKKINIKLPKHLNTSHPFKSHGKNKGDKGF